MRFLFISPTGDSLGIALRVQEEGNEVSFWCNDGLAKKVGNGLVSNYLEDGFKPGKGDTIVFDMTGLGKLADQYRWDGYHVLGGSSLADKLEDDRDYAFEVMDECGIRTPEYYSFGSWEEGKAFAAENSEKVVFKASGDVAETCSSMVCEPKELVELLERLSGEFPGDVQFEIQEFVEGIDLSTEAWFNGKEFVEPFNHTLETKKFMPGDKGPSEGCTGNIVWATDRDDPIVADTVLKLGDFLRTNGYIGPIDVNVIVSTDGPYALEFTPRFGYDATPTLFYELLDCPVGDFIHSCARGDTSFMPLKSGFAAGLRVSVPPWPNQKHEGPQGVEVGGLRGQDYSHFCPMNVMSQDEKIVTAGAWGIVGILTGYGKTIEESFKDPYRIADKMVLSNKQYRTDLPEYFKKRFRKIHSEVSA